MQQGDDQTKLDMRLGKFFAGRSEDRAKASDASAGVTPFANASPGQNQLAQLNVRINRALKDEVIKLSKARRARKAEVADVGEIVAEALKAYLSADGVAD